MREVAIYYHVVNLTISFDSATNNVWYNYTALIEYDVPGFTPASSNCNKGVIPIYSSPPAQYLNT